MNKFGHKDVERLKPATSEPCENSNGNGAGSTSSQVLKTKKSNKGVDEFKKVRFGMGEGECESKVKVGSGKYQVCVGKVPQDRKSVV